MSRDSLATRWEGNDLVVLRNDQPIDRIAASEIRRVILVCQRGDTPSDLSFALIEAGTDIVILPAESGNFAAGDEVDVHFYGNYCDLEEAAR